MKPLLIGRSWPCLDDIISRCRNDGKTHSNWEPGNIPDWLEQSDDCVTRVLREQLWQFNADGYYYMDNQCRSVADRSYYCETLTVQSAESPVSLELDPTQKIEDTKTVAEFPLEPGDSKRWVHWRASENTPLLAYDPNGTGVVNSAQQLFGNHFNGQRYKNGYEALASLDINRDGKLSGKELDGIVLWRDSDRDAVSKPDELVPLELAGIEEIAVRFDHEDKANGFLSATAGFTRVVSGKVVTGRSVDWYSPLYGSKADATLALERGEDGKALPMSNKIGSAEQSQPARKLGPNGPVSGIWQWTATQAEMFGDEPAPRGVLMIREQFGELEGKTLVESAAAKNELGVTTIITSNPIKGQKLGDNKYSFTVLAQNKMPTETEIMLSQDGETLDGVSSFKSGDSTVSYKWSAKRFR